MKCFKIICSILTWIIVACLASMAIIFLGPKIMGYDSMAVISGSMEPNIGVGSLVIVDETDCDVLKEGDVITYELTDGTRVTHRVTKNNTEEKTVITKGDANDTEDAEPISYENIVGKKKISIPLIGYITIYIKTPLGISGVCGIVFILMITIFLPDILSEDDEDKEKEESKDNKEIKTDKKEDDKI